VIAALLPVKAFTLKKFLPFLNGKYSTAPGLAASRKDDPSDPVFLIDRNYPSYIFNKDCCRKENLNKYYCEDRPSGTVMRTLNRWITGQLLQEYPDLFSFNKEDGNYIFYNHQLNELLRWKEDWILIEGNKYRSLFDGLCSQVQEDMAVCELNGGNDRITAIHLCAPNHWAASEKIGLSFDRVHGPVPGMHSTLQHFPKMLKAIVQKERFIRYAWGISSDDRLNHHPVPPLGKDALQWAGRKLGPGFETFVRVERQNLIGFASLDFFLFSIRTFFYPIGSLNKMERIALLNAVQSMTPDSLEYKGLSGSLDFLINLLADNTPVI
jgi:hypothetical protein